MKIVASIALGFALVSSYSVIGQTRNATPDSTPTDRPVVGDAQPSKVGQEPSSEISSATTKVTSGNKQSEENSQPEDPAVAAQKNYESAMALYTSGKFEEAIAALKEANKLRGDDAQTYFLLGMSYMQSKSYKDAADSFRKAIRFRPDWAEAHFRFGVMSYVLGRRNQSTDAYRKLLALESPLANTLYRIIRADNDPADVAETVIADSNSAVANAPQPAPAVSRIQPTGEPDANSASEPSPSSLPSVANSEPARTNDSALTTVYRIGVGDVLDVRFLNSTINRSSLYTVLDGGVIDLPVAGGAIAVVGLSTEEVQARITNELKRRAVEDRPQVSVGIRQYASHTIVVTGLVANPGTKVLRREAVPLYVILADVQPRLDAARAVVMRSGAPASILELSAPEVLNFIIRPGDVINVTSRPQEFYYIAGRVNYPGQKNFQPGITVLQAILAAGGVSNNAKSVEISRDGEGGLLTTTKISLKDIKSGKTQDVKLRAGDRIEVQ